VSNTNINDIPFKNMEFHLRGIKNVPNTGVIHGRFQPLHIGHREYLLAGKERCDYLLIGITNADPSQTRYSPACPHRSSDSANPLTYWERLDIIVGSMLEAGVKRNEFYVVPFPINYPERIFHYTPQNAKYFMTIYDEWGYEKKKILEKLGCSIDVMWTKAIDDKVTSGCEIRRLIADNKPWKHLVPEFTYNYIINNKLHLRIKRLLEGNE